MTLLLVIKHTWHHPQLSFVDEGWAGARHPPLIPLLESLWRSFSPHPQSSFTRCSPAHPGSWTMVLTCAALIRFSAPARLSPLLFRTPQTCQTLYEIIVEGLPSMPAPTVGLLLHPPSTPEPLQKPTEPPASPKKTSNARTPVTFQSLLLVPFGVCPSLQRCSGVIRSIRRLTFLRTLQTSAPVTHWRSVTWPAPPQEPECLEKRALDYHVRFFNKYQFKSTLTPLCYLLLCSAAVTQSLWLLFHSFVLLLLLSLSSPLWIPIPPRCRGSPPAILPFPFCISRLPSAHLRWRSPPLDVLHSPFSSRNPELRLIPSYICVPRSSRRNITVGMCHG